MRTIKKTPVASGTKLHLSVFAATALLTGIVASPPAFADNHLTTPTGENVVAGTATFDRPQEGQLNITQTTERAVIDWDSFNIGENATTAFQQPNATSLAVNRVTGLGTDPTQILGTLGANGNVMVLDRNGVMFGPNAVIDAGGIIASTGDVDNADVMNADNVIQIRDITGGVENAAVENMGSITARDAGLVALVAPTVRNSGVINARLGRVELASGSQATVDLFGDDLVTLAVDSTLENAFIHNNGAIFAEGGSVQVTTQVATDIVDNAINMEGIVDVSSITQEGGRITLAGARDTMLNGLLLAGEVSDEGGITVESANITIGNSGRLQTGATSDGTTSTGTGNAPAQNAANGTGSSGITTVNGGANGGAMNVNANGSTTGTGAGGSVTFAQPNTLGINNTGVTTVQSQAGTLSGNGVNANLTGAPLNGGTVTPGGNGGSMALSQPNTLGTNNTSLTTTQGQTGVSTL